MLFLVKYKNPVLVVLLVAVFLTLENVRASMFSHGEVKDLTSNPLHVVSAKTTNQSNIARGCGVSSRGNPFVDTQPDAHSGKFNPVPGSSQTIQKACDFCHPNINVTGVHYTRGILKAVTFFKVIKEKSYYVTAH
jgi:hypothetical protein